jgi:hypothetical protein
MMPKGILRNVDLFNVFAADLLTRLYTNFPIPQDFSFDQFSWDAIFPSEDTDRLTGVWIAAVRWLVNEGVIRSEHQDSVGSFKGVVLASSGFRALLLGGGRYNTNNLGEALSIAIGSVNTESGKDRVREIVQLVLSAATRPQV